MYCKNCGNELTGEFVFCTNCGHKIEVLGKDEGVGLAPPPSLIENQISPDSGKSESIVIEGQISTKSNHLSSTSQSTSQSIAIHGGNSFIRIALSVLLGIVLFVATVLIVFLFAMRPGNIQGVVANANIKAFLDKTNICEDIAESINNDPMIQLDIDSDDISEFLASGEVSEKIGEIVRKYVDAITLGDYEYHLTPKEITSLLKSLSSDYKLTSADYDRISEQLKESDTLEQYSVGTILADAKVSNVIPYVFFSIYLLLILGALCVLLLFDMLLVNRRKVRTAFLAMGIPLSLTGIIYIVIILLSGVLLKAFSGGSIYMILSLVHGAKSALFIPALISLMLGIVTIGAYIVIRKVKINHSPKPLNNKKVWRIVGLSANLGVLHLCGILMFLCFRNLPEVSAYASNDIDDSLEETSDFATPIDSPSLSPQELQPNDMSVTFRDSDGNILLYKSHILSAEVVSAGNDKYGVQLSLTEEGREKFKEATKKVAGMDNNNLMLYIGETIVVASVVDEMYASSGIVEKNLLITANMSKDEAKHLVALVVGDFADTEAPISDKVNVPSLIGMQMEDAERVLKALGLSAKLQFVDSSESLGVVLEQDVSSGVLVGSGTEVLLEVSLGNGSSVTPTPANVSDADYILPNSSVQALTDDDLKGLSKEELHLARNEIYARYGRQFNDASLQEYFNTKSWYVAIPKLPVGTDPTLSKLEFANIDLIKAYEAK